MLAYGEGHLPPRGDGSRAIVVLTLDDGGSIIEPAVRLPVTDSGAAPCPAWSPDGLRLAFPVAAGFIVMRLDGTSTLIEVQGPGSTFPWGGTFDWSPDGTMIASVRPSGTWLIPVDGGPPRLFATQAARTVSWSPDGAWLAMGDWDGEDSHARLLPVAGVGEEVDLGAGTSRPLWSPSGDRIAYLGRGGIRVAGADGSDE
jgi:Tol biopolymer transport system component